MPRLITENIEVVLGFLSLTWAIFILVTVRVMHRLYEDDDGI